MTQPEGNAAMFNRIVALAVASLPLTALAAPESLTIDPVHTFPNFTVDHLGLSTIYGRFGKSAGKLTIDRVAKTGSVDLSIDTASVDTGDSDKGSRARSRDDHLRSADFFNAAEFPKMTYKSTGVLFSTDTPSVVDGNLTLLGVTKPVKLTLERFKCNPPGANGKERCGGNATGKLKRSDFGMKTGIPAIGDDITLLISFEAAQD
jgi:polyisoprenoid-binding protein YceI